MLRPVLHILGVLPLLLVPQIGSAAITQIDVSGGRVTASRPLAGSGSGASGVAPLHVFFDATRVSCTSTLSGIDSECTHSAYSPALHFLNYEWTYGDPNSGTWEIAGSQVTGRSKDESKGFLGAHLYETPGDYTVQLSVRDNISGLSATRSFSFSVADPNQIYAGSNTTCISATGSFVGCPAGAATLSTSDWASALAGHYGPGRRILFRRGDRFVSASGFTLSGSGPTTIGSFGSGAKPSLTLASPGYMWTCAVNARDIRLMDLHFWDASTPFSDRNNVLECSRYTQHIVLLRTEIEPNKGGTVVHASWRTMATKNDELVEGMGLYENHWVKIKGLRSGINAMLLTARRLTLLGNEIRDTLTDEPGERTEHIFRMMHYEQVLIANNYLGEEGTGRSILTLRSFDITPDPTDGTGNQCIGSTSSWCSTPSRFLVVSDNDFITSEAPIRGCGNEKPAIWTASCHDVLIDRNFIHAPPSSPYGMFTAMMQQSLLGLSIRNNIIDCTSNTRICHAYKGPSAWGNGSPGGDFLYAYNNTCYWKNKGGWQFHCIRADGGATRKVVRNNLLFTTGNTGGSTTVVKGTGIFTQNILATSNPFVVANPVKPSDFRTTPGGSADGAGAAPPGNQWDFGGSLRTQSSAPAGAWGGGGSPKDFTPPASPVLLQ